MDNYEDIIDHEHHVSPVRPQMTLHDRAAQFAPFAALTGFYDMIDEKTGSAYDLSGSPEKNGSSLTCVEIKSQKKP